MSMKTNLSGTSHDSNTPQEVAQKVFLTRRRWNYYFLPVTIIAAAGGAVSAAISGDAMLLLAPIPLLVLWTIMYFVTPAKGEADNRISAVSGLTHLLYWNAFVLLLFIAASVINEYCLKSLWVGSYVWMAYPLLLVLWFFGIHRIEKRKMRKNELSNS